MVRFHKKSLYDQRYFSEFMSMINGYSEKLYKLYDMYDHVVWHIEVLEVNTRDGMSWYIRLKFEMNCC